MESLYNLIFVSDDPVSTLVNLFIVLFSCDIVAIVLYNLKVR